MALVQYKNIDVLRRNASRPSYNFFDSAQMRRIERRSSGSALVAGALTLYYEEEQVKLHGVARVVKRLYIHDPSRSSPLSKIGWILDEDVDRCMLCDMLFAFNKSKSHCRACGNVFCRPCSRNFIPFADATSLGPQRVCNLCFYGQTSISIIPTSPEKIIIDRNTPKHSPTRGTKSPLSTDPEPRRLSGPSSQRSGFTNRILKKKKSLLSIMFPSVGSDEDDTTHDVARDLPISQSNNSPASSVTSLHLQRPSAFSPLSAAFRSRDSDASTLDGFSTPHARQTSVEARAAKPKAVLVADGIVSKVNSLHVTKVRRLLLTTKPSLIYMKPSGEIKGEIPWSRDFPCVATLVDSTHFQIATKARVYKFHTDFGNPHDARYWVDNINNISKNFSG